MNANGIYSGYRICENLEEKEKCFRLQKYDEGDMVEVFHEHVPRHRISDDNSHAFMRALLISFSGIGGQEILHTHLNNRGQEPPSRSLCQVVVEYPEPGVLRKYFSSGDLTAWFDHVISPEMFRSEDEDN